MAISQFPEALLSESYGKYTAIRSVYLRRGPGVFYAALEDTFHALDIIVQHNAGIVSAIDAQWTRHPYSSCVGATDAIKQHIGLNLSAMSQLLTKEEAQSQCTHIVDILKLIAMHFGTDFTERRYDVIAPDNKSHRITAKLFVDSSLTLEVETQLYDQIITPTEFAGRSLYRGLLPWIAKTFDQNTFLHWFLLQKALFVARGQLVSAEDYIGKVAALTGPPANSCFGSQRERYDRAVRVDSIRRFAEDDVTQLLQFKK